MILITIQMYKIFELDIDNDNEEVDEDPPLVFEEEPTESAESSSEQPTPGLSSQYRVFLELQLGDLAAEN
ncbi:unnamed protein product [Parnassius apollo]|uniref:(apollo) hypothetical protein n=1 Tax=Parnassius apollo TaxID=110799 RepID=A0A8S3XQR4_PARAO|nr:unnamed protein product [Parnassius apollo]